MAFEILTKGKYKVVQVDDDVTSPASLHSLQSSINKLLRFGSKDFVLDFSNIKTMDSRVLSVVGEIYRRINERDGSLNVIVKDNDMENVFNLSGFSLLVRVFQGQEDLIEAHKEIEAQPAKTLTARPQSGEKALQVSTNGPYTVVHAAKELETLVAVNALRKTVNELLGQGKTKLILDFEELSTVASSVLGFLANVYGRIKDKEGEICVVAKNKEVIDLFNVAGLNQFINFVHNQDEFLAGIKDRDEDVALKRVLIVDDSKTSRRLLAKKVKALGYAVVQAESGKQSLEIVETQRPDLVLMDVEMPGMDGYQACKAIKGFSGDKYVPVVFVTGRQAPQERLRALEAGGDDFITKPVQEEDLVFRIKTHLRIGELNRSLRHVNENLEDLVSREAKEKLETERQLYQAEKMSAVGTMLSGIAHEMKNPLFIISTHAAILKRGKNLDERMEKGIQNIEEQSAKASTIVENMLNLVRKKAVKTALVNVNELVGGLMGNLQYMTTDKEVVMSSHLQARNVIRGNPTDMEQIIVNLVSNAVDAIKGKGEVRIHTKDDGRWCKILVEDTGTGMPEDVAKRIFDPFYTTKDTGKGTGLGLSITFRLVQSHNGLIKVKSEPGKGTTFTVQFPKA